MVLQSWFMTICHLENIKWSFLYHHQCFNKSSQVHHKAGRSKISRKQWQCHTAFKLGGGAYTSWLIPRGAIFYTHSIRPDPNFKRCFWFQKTYLWCLYNKFILSTLKHQTQSPVSYSKCNPHTSNSQQKINNKQKTTFC